MYIVNTWADGFIVVKTAKYHEPSFRLKKEAIEAGKKLALKYATFLLNEKQQPIVEHDKMWKHARQKKGKGMSTRCQLGFYYDTIPDDLSQIEALIYRHCDGYPKGKQGVVKGLVSLIKRFRKKRGFWDAEGCAAWVRTFQMKDVTDFGVSQYLHSDIEYYYAIGSKEIRVYRTESDADFRSMIVLGTIRW